MKSLVLDFVLALAAMAMSVSSSACAERFYVSTSGNDQWSGGLARPNIERTDGPFASVRRAQDAVRLLDRGTLRAPVEVIIQDGTYYLDQPLIYGPNDSGTAGSPITYRAAHKGQAILSGGKIITGWHCDEAGVYGTSVPEARGGQWAFRLLRVGDRWATRARHPNGDPEDAYRGKWLFAKWAGQPWERGVFGSCVANVHNAGDRLTWQIVVPAAATYRVWLRYSHHMRADGTDDMSGRTALVVDAGDPVPLNDLPDTGGWASFRWADSAILDLTEGEHDIAWVNLKGGGLAMDVFALTDDRDWNPAKSFTNFQWWGAYDFTPPAVGKQLLLIHSEAADKVEAKEAVVPRPTPPGTKQVAAFAEGDLPRWKDVAGAEMHVFIAWGWVNAIVPVDRIDYDAHRIIFAGKGASQDVRMGNRFFIENVKEALDAPGEWYLDTETGGLTYLSDARDRSLRQPVVAPRLDRLIVLQGDPGNGRYVEHLRFEGLTFADTDYTVTADYYTPADSAIWATGARDCRISDCEFTGLGGYALRLETDSHRIEFVGNRVHAMGQGGVIMLGDDTDHPHHDLVAGNVMRDLGLVYKHVGGVYCITGSDNRIAHNTITDVPRYGVAMKTLGPDNSSHRNIVEFNDIRRSNLETNDTRAIETLGRDRQNTGNIIRHNLILDSVGMGTTSDGEIRSPYFTWGIYLDDYSSGTLVEGNIVVRTDFGAVCLHGGKDNRFENNIFIQGDKHQIRLQPRDEFMRGNRFLRNIVAYSRRDSDLIYTWQWSYRRENFAEWDYNLYWLSDGDLNALNVRNTPEGTFADWRKAGFDAHSLVADPRFENAAEDDYRLRDDSPAWHLGLKRIPAEKTGAEGWTD